MTTIDASCPQCGAEYKLTPEQLKVANGQVRCGACMTVFQAGEVAPPTIDITADELVGGDEEKVEISSFVGEESVDDSMLDSAIASSSISRSGEGDFFYDDLGGAESSAAGSSFEQEADLHHADESWAEDLLGDDDEEESAVLKDESVAAAPKTAAPAPKPAEANIDAFAESVELSQDFDELDVDESDKAGLLNRIPPEPLQLKVKRDHSGVVNLLFSLIAVLSFLGLVVQLLWFNVDTLGRKAEWRSVYGPFCEYVSCQLPDQYNVAEISASSTHQKTHAAYKRALVLETVLTNHARFKQPFPNVEVYFKNMKGKVIAARQFSPDEYLRGEIANSQFMPKRQPVHIALEIDDPGRAATGYELHLSYN